MRLSDHEAVTTLCAQMWDGHDYIPQVFDAWLAHTQGQFTAVLDEEHHTLIGVGKLTSITDRDWWIEGLRVDSRYRGKGVGRRLHAYHVDLWQQISPPSSALRLVTDSDNYAVHHLCDDAGFVQLGAVTPFRAEALNAPHSFRQSDKGDFSLVERSHYYHSHHHLYQTQTLWRWAELTAQALSQRDVWLWREGKGLIIVEDVEDADNPLSAPCLFIDFIGVEQSDLVGCLRDARALAASFTRSVIGIGLSLSDTVLIEALTKSGYTRAWDEGSLYLYEKRK